MMYHYLMLSLVCGVLWQPGLWELFLAPSPDYKFTLLYYLLTLFFECLSSYRGTMLFLSPIKQCNRSHCKQFCALFIGVSGNRLLNRGPQLPHSPGLNLFNWFLIVRHIKCKVYSNIPWTEDDVRRSIQNRCSHFYQNCNVQWACLLCVTCISKLKVTNSRAFVKYGE
jgi:hypothetical protein